MNYSVGANVVMQAWGVRVDPGVQIPPHDHHMQRISIIYYLTRGVGLRVGGVLVPCEPGVMVSFLGSDQHWMSEPQQDVPRYSIAMAVN